MQPRLSGDCGAEAESAATDAAGAGGGSTADGAAKDATAAAEKARTFSQEDVDRMTAEARRQGKESAKKAADAQIEKIATKTRDSLLEEFRKQGILKDGAAATGDKGAGSATHGAEAGADKSKGTAQNAAQGATAGDADKGKGAVDPAILALQEEVKAERAAREAAWERSNQRARRIIESVCTGCLGPWVPPVARQVATRPDVVGEWELPADQRSLFRYFNPAAFAANAVGTFGTAPRNLLRGPGGPNFDLAFMKIFSPVERVRIQFRAELFNSFNTPILGTPFATQNTPARFGRIESAGDPRIVQLGLHYRF
jgi:hypothetical protein